MGIGSSGCTGLGVPVTLVPPVLHLHEECAASRSRRLVLPCSGRRGPAIRPRAHSRSSGAASGMVPVHHPGPSRARSLCSPLTRPGAGQLRGPRTVIPQAERGCVGVRLQTRRRPGSGPAHARRILAKVVSLPLALGSCRNAQHRRTGRVDPRSPPSAMPMPRMSLSCWPGTHSIGEEAQVPWPPPMPSTRRGTASPPCSRRRSGYPASSIATCRAAGVFRRSRTPPGRAWFMGTARSAAGSASSSRRVQASSGPQVDLRFDQVPALRVRTSRS